MIKNNDHKTSFEFKKTAIAVASVFVLLSSGAHAAVEVDTDADAGPLGAAASAATGASVSVTTGDAVDEPPSAAASASGNIAAGNATDTEDHAAAAAAGLLDGLTGADADYDDETDIADDIETVDSVSAEANASSVIEETDDPDRHASYAGAAVAEARSAVENKTVNHSGSAAITLTSSSESNAEVYIDAYDFDDDEFDGDEAEAAAAAAAAAFSSAKVANNSVNNLGVIEDSVGIELSAYTDAYAEADAEATADAADNVYEDAKAEADAETYAESTVADNTVTNSGTILSADAGISIDAAAEARAYSTAAATTSADSDSDAWALAVIENNSITNTGNITVSDGAGVILYADAYADDSGDEARAESIIAANTIINRGTIDADSSGISLQAWATVGQNNDSSTLAVIAENSIDNAGTIIVRDASLLGAGINMRAVSGTFFNTPTDADSLVVDNSVTNSGMIAVAGPTLPSVLIDWSGYGADGIRLRAYGIEAGVDSDAIVGGNIISNTGRIYAMDDGIELSAVHSVDDVAWVVANTIENIGGGRIVAADVGIKIFSDGNVEDNTIRNSGLIVSDTGMELDGATLIKSDPIDFLDGNDIGTAILVRSYDDDHEFNNVLELNAPSYLAGTILLDKNADVEVTLNSGASHSTRWAIQRDSGYAEDEDDQVFGQQDQGLDYNWFDDSVTRANLTGPVPWFVNEGLEDDINGMRNDVYATLDPSAFAASANVLADLSGMVSTMAKTGMARTADQDGFWLSGHGAKMDYNGDNHATMDQDTRLVGGSLGYTHNFDAVRVGVLAGYSDAELQVGGFYNDIYSHSYDNESKGGFAGIYVNGDIGWLNLNAGISGGRLNHDDKRFVNDNLKWWGISYATADYDSTWYSPEITLAVPFDTAGGLTITPNVHLQYTRQNIDSYTEKGSDSNARVSSRDIAVSEAKVGLDITKTIGMASLTGRVGYLNRNSHGDNSVKVTMIGDTQEVPFFYQDINAAYVGAALNVELGERVDFNLSGNYLAGGDIESSGNATAMLRFKY